MLSNTPNPPPGGAPFEFRAKFESERFRSNFARNSKRPLPKVTRVRCPGTTKPPASRAGGFESRLRRGSVEQGVDERSRLERGEVVRPLAEADELDRDAELALD